MILLTYLFCDYSRRCNDSLRPDPGNPSCPLTDHVTNLGISVSDLTKAIDSFHSSQTGDNGIPEITDNNFLGSVLKQLSQHPDIGIGADPDEEHHGSPLDSFLKSSTPLTEQSGQLPRIFTTSDRVYEAICGHPTDEKRISELEYGLLIHIAAARSEGILQSDLNRITGQDKRAVPQRTASLHAKGYIHKVDDEHRVRLTLRRFATSSYVARNDEQDDTASSAQNGKRTVQGVSDEIANVQASVGEQSVPHSGISPHPEHAASLGAATVESVNDASVEKRPSRQRRRPARLLDSFDTPLRPTSDDELEPTSPSRRKREYTMRETPDGESTAATPGPKKRKYTKRNEPDSDSDAESPSRKKKKYTWRERPDGDAEQQRGRPRKFLKGTEKFWQYQFWRARVDAEGLEAGASKSGTANHPAGNALFKSRPDKFDEVLLLAIEAGLPLPRISEDVSNDWMQGTLRVLRRDKPGVYITPVGMHLTRVKYKSLMLTLRTEKLKVIKLSDPQRVYRHRFLISSAAHSFQIWRWAPAASPPAIKNRNPAARTFEVEYPSDLVDGFRQLPQPQASTEAIQGSSRVYRYRFLSSSAAHSSQSWPWSPSTYGSPQKKRRPAERHFDVEYPPDLLAIFGPLPQPIYSGEAARCSPVDEAVSPSHVAEGLVELSNVSSPTNKREQPLDSSLVGSKVPSPEPLVEPDVTHPSEIDAQKLSTTTSSQQREPRSRNGRHPSAAQHHRVQSNTREPLSSSAPQTPATPDSVPCRNRDDRTSSVSTSDRPRRLRRPTQRALDSGITNLAPDVESPAASIAVDSEDDLSLVNGIGGAREASTERPSRKATRSRRHREQKPLESKLSLPPPQDLPAHQAPYVGYRESTPVSDAAEEGRTAFGCYRPVLDGQEAESSQSASRPAIRSLSTHGAFVTLYVHSPHQIIQPLPSSSTNMPAVQIPGTSSRQKRRVSEPLDSESSLNGRPKKICKVQEPNHISTCQDIIIKLLQLNNAAGPDNHVILRRASGALWEASEFCNEFLPLPNLTTMKRAIDRAVRSKQIKQHTFSFRGPQGVMEKRSIIYLADVPLSDPRIADLRSQMVALGQEELFPDTWTDSGPRRINTPYLQTTLINRSDSNTSSQFGSGRASVSSSTPDPSLVQEKSGTPSSSSGDHIHAAFLTLSVPRLGTLPQVLDFNKQFQRPLHLDSIFNTPVVAPKRQRKPRVEKAKLPHLRKDLWKKRDIPDSLGAIVYEQLVWESRTAQIFEEDANGFFDAVDLVSDWELRLVDKLTTSKIPWTFISHSCHMKRESSSPATSWSLLQLNDEEEFVEVRVTEFKSWAPFVRAQTKLDLLAGLDSVAPTPASAKGRVTRQATGSIRKKRQFVFEEADLEPSSKRRRHDEDAPFEYEPDTPRVKRSQRENGISGRNVHSDDEDISGDSEPPMPKEKRPYNKKPKQPPIESQYAILLSKLSNEDIFRFGTIVLLVSILAGGSDKTIDWETVAKLQPGTVHSTLKKRWKAIESIYAEQLADAAAILRDEYIVAVASETVPLVDPAEAAANDWPDILDWALVTLPNFVNDKSLPSIRQSLEQKYDTKFDPPPNCQILTAPNALKIHEREQLVSSVPFSTTTATAKVSDMASHARSIILATLLGNKNATVMKSAVSLLSALSLDHNVCEQATATALSQLLSDGLVNKVDSSLKRKPPLIENNRLAYTIADKFEEYLGPRRSIINHELLHEATAYKLEVLDPVFADNPDSSFRVANQTKLTDGQMLALINLLHVGMVAIRPGKDSVKSRYGISWEKVEYNTRYIDQADLGFEVVIKSTAAYRMGELGDATFAGGDDRGLQLPPRRGLQGQTPVWCDIITLEVVRGRWEKSLAAIVGGVHLRPAVSVPEIVAMMGGVLTEWEVQTVLEWAKQHGFVKKATPHVNGGELQQEGWKTERSWWWCCR